ncbi:MAG: translation initiation factor [Bacteroidales bacterium]|nr:translation initiation factor [Bacteroidales bacterium]
MMNMNNNWQDSLAALLNSGTLPDGEQGAKEVVDDKHKEDQRGKLVISIEKKGRSGKTATIISGFTIAPNDLDLLAKKIKSTLGTGGSARGGEILIQGDRRQDVRRLLTSLGYTV